MRPFVSTHRHLLDRVFLACECRGGFESARFVFAA
jgi:hypothetical protein